MRTAAATAGLLGGLCWVGALWSDALVWVGGVLLGLAVLGAGAGLVRRGAVWLRLIVAVCFLALVGSVIQVLRDNLDQTLVFAVAGVAAVIAAAVALSRRPEPPAHHHSRSRGAHAA
jgi:hypothetical protein